MRRSQRHMYPRPFIDQLRVRQVIYDIRQPSGLHGDVHGAAFGVVGVRRSAYGLVEGFAAEPAVYFNRYAKVLTQRFQDLGAQTYEVIDFLIVNAILYFSLLGDLASKHLFFQELLLAVYTVSFSTTISVIFKIT